MKNAFKAIILLMILFVILAGCSSPSTGSSDSQQSQSTDGIPFDIGDNAKAIWDDEKGFGDDGFFYSFWKDGTAGTVGMYNWPNSFYGFWNSIHGAVMGKGWPIGKVNFWVDFGGYVYSTADAAGVDDDYYLALYGWADNGWDASHPEKLIEYYVVEQHGTKGHGKDFDGDWGEQGDTYESNGEDYTAWKTRRDDKPSIRGDVTDFDQYWAVRATQRGSGRISFANHVQGWKDSGWTELNDDMMDDNQWTYQIIILEAPYDNNYGTGWGYANITDHNRPHP